MGPRKILVVGPTLLLVRKAEAAKSHWRDFVAPPGSKTEACHQGSFRNLGDLEISTLGMRKETDTARSKVQARLRGARGSRERRRGARWNR